MRGQRLIWFVLSAILPPWIVLALVLATGIHRADAAVSCANPTNGIFDSTTTASTYTTASITPNSGELALVTVVNRKGTATDTPTLTGTNGWNVTWTAIDSLRTGGSTLAQLTLFRGVPSSGTAGTLSADFAGASQLQGVLLVVLCSGVDQASSQGIVQSANDSAASGTTHAVTLAAFGDAGNGTALASAARGTPGPTYTPEGSFTAYSTMTGIAGAGVEWLASNDTTPSAVMAGGTNWAAIGVELKATGGAPPAANQFFKRRIMRY